MFSPKKAAKLLLSIPYCIKAGPLPTCAVVNNLLIRGYYDAGMSGAINWKPFELSEDEYKKVIIELQHLKAGLFRDDSPLTIDTYEDWKNWLMIRKVGEKGPELADLYRERKEISAQIKKIYEHNDEEKAEALLLGLMRIEKKIGDLLVSSRKPK